MAIYILGPDQDGTCCTCAERVNVCDTCTAGCTFDVPPLPFSPWPDLADAQSALANLGKICKVYLNTSLSSIPFISAFTASEGAGTLDSSVTIGSPGSSAGMNTLFSVKNSTASTINFDVNVTITFNASNGQIILIPGGEDDSHTSPLVAVYPQTLTAGSQIDFQLLTGTDAIPSNASITTTFSISQPGLQFCSFLIRYMDGLDEKLLPCP